MDSKISTNHGFNENVDLEIYLLILKYLHYGPCESTSQILKEELSKLRILPKRYDWKGREHEVSIDDWISKYDHISNDYLRQILHHIIPLVNKDVTVGVPKVSSLLGAGRHSIIRKDKDCKYIKLSRSIHSLLQNNCSKILPDSTLFPQNFVDVLNGRQICGRVQYNSFISPHVCQKISLMFRTLGHLSSVYCVAFDQTGNYIFTGSDDHLLKVWSMQTGRLLYTYRGHNGEITDISVSHDNTLLATGSCDKLVRVWSLSTTAPIAVLHGHTNMITSLKFSPYSKSNVKLLISTGGDGCLCIWEYNNESKIFNTKPIKFIERSRAGTQMMCSSFSPGGAFLTTGSSDCVIRVFRLNGTIAEKICELEAHENPIDTIIYANHSTRFVSGSKDSIARVWRYEAQEWRATMLNMEENLNKNREGLCSTTHTNLQVTMVCWSSDDVYIITAANDFTIKIWISADGKLYKELQGHTDEVFVLENNPVDGTIVLSAGHDGNIFVWNIVKGSKLWTFKNNIDGQGHGSIFDCKWTPDGLSFAATDAHGNLLVFATGSNQRYLKIPDQMFFHTDYRPLIRDLHDNVIDEQTEEVPHFMPPPFLVDIDGAPYPPHLQRLVPGREQNTDTQLVPLVVVLPDGTREVLDSMAVEEGQLLNEMITQMQQQQDERLMQGRVGPPPPPNHPPPDLHELDDGQASNRGEGQDVRVFDYEQRARRLNQSIWSKRCLIPSIAKDIQIQNSKRYEELAEEEHKLYIREKQKKNFIFDESSNDSYYPMRRCLKNARRGQLLKQTKEEKRRNRLERRALYDTDASDHQSEIDIKDKLEPNFPEDKKQITDSDTLESDSSFSDWAPKNGTARRFKSDQSVRPKRYTRASQKSKYSPTTSQTKSSSASETETDMENYCELENVEMKVVGRRQMRKKNIEADQDSEKENSELESIIVPPVDWLTSVLPRKTPYFPQEGDEIIYMMQGHQQYVDAVQSRNIYEIDPEDPMLPWNRKPPMREQEILRILTVDHIIKPPRLISLQLVIIDPETGKAISPQFNIKYHDMTGVIDFLILRHQYELSMKRNWKACDKFRCIIEETWWHGTILEHQPFQQEYPDSMFQCFNIRWDNDEFEKLSPWDLEPIDNKRIPSNRAGSVNVTTAEWNTMRIPFKAEEWPEVGPKMESQRLLNGLEHIMSLSIAEPFLVPVDLNEFPMYAQVIAYPIDLNTIKQRIHNNFYRRPAAICDDVRWIEINAMKFNRPLSKIVKQAKLVVNVCLRFINDHECHNVMEIYEKMSCKDISSAAVSSSSSSHNYYDHDDVTDNNVESTSARNKEINEKININWKKECLHILQMVSKSNDAIPFRSPAKLDELLDYSKIVTEPMDLGTVASKLKSGRYRFIDSFVSDMRLIFSNSKLYNTNKKSKIYVMTLRASAMFEHLLSELNTKMECSLNPVNNYKCPANISGTPQHSGSNNVAWKYAPSTRKQANSHKPVKKKRRLRFDSVDDSHKRVLKVEKCIQNEMCDSDNEDMSDNQQNSNHDLTSDSDITYNEKPRKFLRKRIEKTISLRNQCNKHYYSDPDFKISSMNRKRKYSRRHIKDDDAEVEDSDFNKNKKVMKKFKNKALSRSKFGYAQNLDSPDDDDSGILVQRRVKTSQTNSGDKRRQLNLRIKKPEDTTRHFASISKHYSRNNKNVHLGTRVLRSNRLAPETETSNDVPDVSFSRKRLRSMQPKKIIKPTHSDTESYNSEASRNGEPSSSFSNFRNRTIQLRNAEQRRFVNERRIVTRRQTLHCESSNDVPQMSSRGRLYKPAHTTNQRRYY